MKLFDDYLSAVEAIHRYFEYVEDWVVIPLDDGREYYWRIQGGEAHDGRLCYAKTEQELNSGEGNYYEAPLYTQRFLPRWVYRAEGYTMVSIDTQTDGNKFLIVLDNAKERKLGHGDHAGRQALLAAFTAIDAKYAPRLDAIDKALTALDSKEPS